MLTVQVRMQERQLHGVPALFDLLAQATDILVSDVRNFFKDEVLHLSARDLLQGVTCPGIKRQRIAHFQVNALERSR
ncbi:hypothetical protein D3C73_1416440 [compost metagenome]